MARIAHNKEVAVLNCLKANSGVLSARGIASICGVSTNSVIRIQHAHETASGTPSYIKNKARRLFLEHVSMPRIAAQLGIPVQVLRDLQRAGCLEPQDDDVKACSKCGTLISSPFGRAGGRSNRKKCRRHVSQRNAHDLCDIALDVLNLHELRLITSPLFNSIAQKAERVYDKLHGKTKEKADTHGH